MAKADIEKSLLAKEPWRSPLEELERTLSEVGRAIRSLRGALESGDAGGTAEPPIHAVVVEEAETQAGKSDTTNEVSSADKPTVGTTVLGRAKSSITSFEHVWERLQREGQERSAAPAEEEEIEEVRGLSKLPSEYRITIEDRDGTPVDLLPVQRALRAFASADDVSLLNFANGTAVISMRATGELDLDKLALAIGMATSRECEVIPQDQGKLFLRLSAEEGNRNG